MQKEKKQIILNSLARKIRENIPEGKAPTTLAMEYDLSPSIMSTSLKGKKDVQLTTFYHIAGALNKKPYELLKEIDEDLPDNFSPIDP